MSEPLSATIKQRRPAATGSDQPSPEGADTASGSSMTWPRAVVLIAAFCFVGAAAGYYFSNRQPSASSVDVGFYQDMIAHHEQAQTLAALELAYGGSSDVKTFAKEVLIQQSYEIGVMKGELDDWGQGRQGGETSMEWMGMSVPADQMPGLASEDQVDALERARGTEADSLFLGLMAEHHRGGLHMASYAAERADESGVRELAARMRYNQATEINEYAATAERLGLPITIPRTAPVENPAGD